MYQIKTLDILGTVLESEYFLSQPDMAAIQRQAVSKWGKGVVVQLVSNRYVPKVVAKNSTQVFKK